MLVVEMLTGGWMEDGGPEEVSHALWGLYECLLGANVCAADFGSNVVKSRMPRS